MKKIRVIYAEDHIGFRQTVIRELNALGIRNVTGVSNGKELIDSMSPRPDVVLLDLQMPVMNGSQTLDQILKNWPGTRIIIVSMHFEEMLVENYLARGAKGYISKDAFAGNMELLVKAIHKVASGKTFRPEVEEDEKFSPRQKELIPLIVEGYTNKEISARTGILQRSVEKQKQRIYSKVGDGRAVEFYKYAFSRGLQFLGRAGKRGSK
jgi:DNA-binding NarL/FixJ family response regulator